jgi:hypothetical protein
MVLGVLVMPSLGSVAITVTGSYLAAYGAIAVLATLAAVVLAWPLREGRALGRPYFPFSPFSRGEGRDEGRRQTQTSA